MFQLSGDKELQERGVIDSLSAHFPNDIDDLEIRGVKDLPEADHDFILETNRGNITVQLTEIVERDYTSTISRAEYDSGRYSEYILAESGKIPLAIDHIKRDNVIVTAIRRKISKNYANQSDPLWLVIFSTSPYLQTVFSQSGKVRTSTAYENAVAYIQSKNIGLFENVWYYNLITRPVRIWPRE